MIRGSSENSSFIASLSLETSSKLAWHLQIFFKKGNIFWNFDLIKLNHVNLICEGKNQDSTVCIGQGQFCHGRELLVLKVDLNDVNSSPKVKCWSYNVLHWPGSCWEGKVRNPLNNNKILWLIIIIGIFIIILSLILW